MACNVICDKIYFLSLSISLYLSLSLCLISHEYFPKSEMNKTIKRVAGAHLSQVLLGSFLQFCTICDLAQTRNGQKINSWQFTLPACLKKKKKAYLA